MLFFMVRMKHINAILFTVLISVPLTVCAQWYGSVSDRVNTLRTITCGDWERAPIITLGSDETIEFSFDEMSHRYHRFTYHITHCDARWEASDLIESEYMEGFNDQPIDSWENSLNTTFALPDNPYHRYCPHHQTAARHTLSEVCGYHLWHHLSHHLSVWRRPATGVGG